MRENIHYMCIPATQALGVTGVSWPRGRTDTGHRVRHLSQFCVYRKMERKMERKRERERERERKREKRKQREKETKIEIERQRERQWNIESTACSLIHHLRIQIMVLIIYDQFLKFLPRIPSPYKQNISTFNYFMLRLHHALLPDSYHFDRKWLCNI